MTFMLVGFLGSDDRHAYAGATLMLCFHFGQYPNVQDRADPLNSNNVSDMSLPNFRVLVPCLRAYVLEAGTTTLCHIETFVALLLAGMTCRTC